MSRQNQYYCCILGKILHFEESRNYRILRKILLVIVLFFLQFQDKISYLRDVLVRNIDTS